MKMTFIPSHSIALFPCILLHAGDPGSAAGNQACLNVGLQLLLFSLHQPVSWPLLMCTEHGQESQGTRNNLLIRRELFTGSLLHQRKWRIFPWKRINKVNNVNPLWKEAINADLQHPSPDVQVKSTTYWVCKCLWLLCKLYHPCHH